MKRAKDTSFVPWEGGVRTIHYRQAFEDDDPVVVAFPSLFEPLPTAGRVPAVAEVSPPAAAPPPGPALTSGWQDEPTDQPVVRDRRGRGRRGGA